MTGVRVARDRGRTDEAQFLVDGALRMVNACRSELSVERELRIQASNDRRRLQNEVDALRAVLWDHGIAVASEPDDSLGHRNDDDEGSTI